VPKDPVNKEYWAQLRFEEVRERMEDKKALEE